GGTGGSRSRSARESAATTIRSATGRSDRRIAATRGPTSPVKQQTETDTFEKTRTGGWPCVGFPCRLGPERSSVDLAGPPANDLPPGVGTRQPRARRGDRARDRPRDDRRGARAHGTGGAQAASPLQPRRRSLALPLSRGTRKGEPRRCRGASSRTVAETLDIPSQR